jgi:hypothetical protein
LLLARLNLGDLGVDFVFLLQAIAINIIRHHGRGTYFLEPVPVKPRTVAASDTSSTAGQHYEKNEYVHEETMSRRDYYDDEEEDEDMDALIDELESQDGDNADYEEEETDQPGGARVIPEDLLQTDTRLGLNSAEVMSRRKKFGFNQMKGMLQ